MQLEDGAASQREPSPHAASSVPLSMLDLSAAAAQSTATSGCFRGLDGEGRPLVEYPGQPSSGPQVARLAFPVAAEEILKAAEEERRVLLLFERGDRALPIAAGWLLDRPVPQARPSGAAREVFVNDERIVWEADRELILRCGRSSILLRRDGKVEIKGKYLLSRSSGVNKIKGGSVEIN
ncbi:MAG: hypothetical protein JXA90_07795 [Planctomycetes bacterium]|nr:hypothetical protein [Planctomycetota bacterium]